MAERQWSTDQLYIHFTEIFKQQELLADARNKNNTDRVESIETLLREHVEAAAKELQTAFNAAQRAMDKAEMAQDKRNDDADSFRKQTSELIARFPTRDYIDTRLDDFGARYQAATEELSKRLYDERQARGQESQTMLLALANRITNESFDQYVERQEDLQTSARRSQVNASISVAIAVLSVAVSIALAIFTHGH